MTWIVDVVAVIILLGALGAGLRSGFAATLGALLGLAAGAAAAVWALPHVSAAVDPPWRTVAVLGALFLLLVVGCGIGSSIGGLIRRGADRIHLRVLERLLGGVLGLVLGLVVVMFGGAGLVSAGIPGVSSTVASSRVLQQIDRATPEPVDDALAQLRAEVVGALPMPTIVSPPEGLGEADVPTSAPVDLDQADLTQAAQSVARVSGPTNGCGTISTGSGFVVAPDRIVTNAHVVAGVDHPMVELPGESAREGRVVHFDVENDLAVIAADVDAEPLKLVDALDDGASAVIQGYPHGGPFRSEPATVRASGSAEVHDAHGEGSVRRDIYVLDAEVEPGNSGGPLLDSDGGVAGVVFARGESDDDVAYAMTNAELLPVIAQLDSETETVSTGACTA
ncbi:MarP family serine protease [Brachybacterium halotolerans subsp. kimchii]|uniref:MarP family serine protease n=1 Tax=Brachybacterium halotolerans TaxID=2795215 RepID=UPI001E62F15C|nr:MarP family serine protease [Brachybacterium halotolerans]UEJ81882.1 MarP family serine protease [Brachybacterium halotolerans subsp. kimchii]